MTPEIEALGRRARLLRLERQWTQEDLARRAGTTANTIRGFERGTIRTRTEIVDRVARALETTREALARPTEPVRPGDPILHQLNREDLLIARMFHDSPTAIRTRVAHLLTSRDAHQDQADVLTTERLVRFSEEDRRLFHAFLSLMEGEHQREQKALAEQATRNQKYLQELLERDRARTDRRRRPSEDGPHKQKIG